eukprot:735541-Pelagomonas_calceolata.AAC.2
MDNANITIALLRSASHSSLGTMLIPKKARLNFFCAHSQQFHLIGTFLALECSRDWAKAHMGA